MYVLGRQKQHWSTQFPDLQATVSSQNEYNPLFVACCNPQTVVTTITSLLALCLLLIWSVHSQNNVKIVRLLLGLKTLPPLQLVPQSPPLIPEISTPRIVRGNTPLMAAAFYGRLGMHLRALDWSLDTSVTLFYHRSCAPAVGHWRRHKGERSGQRKRQRPNRWWGRGHHHRYPSISPNARYVRC